MSTKGNGGGAKPQLSKATDLTFTERARELVTLTMVKRDLSADELARVQELVLSDLRFLHGVGSIGTLAETQLLTAASAGRRGYQEELRLGGACVREELGWGTATKLEQLLIDEIVLAHLSLSLVRIEYTGAVHEPIACDPGIRNHWDRHLSAAQRRYIRAIESLARVRKLDLPSAVQINVATDGAQQANMLATPKARGRKASGKATALPASTAEPVADEAERATSRRRRTGT